MIHALHANWSGGMLRVWAESDGLWALHERSHPAPRLPAADGAPPRDPRHPFAPDADSLRESLPPAAALLAGPAEDMSIFLPSRNSAPDPSSKLAHAVGQGDAPTAIQERRTLQRFAVPTLGVPIQNIGEFLDSLCGEGGEFEGTEPDGPLLGPSVWFFSRALHLARSLMAQQRFVPSLRQDLSGELSALWQPWLADTATAHRVAMLVHAAPPIVRAPVDEFDHQPWAIVEHFLNAIVDAESRRILSAEGLLSALGGRSPSDDLQVAWLAGLLGEGANVPVDPQARSDIARVVRRWIANLEDRGVSSAWRLCIRLNEPPEHQAPADLAEPLDRVAWELSFHLQSHDADRITLDAADVWLLPTDSATVEGRRIDHPQELLLSELTRIARIYPPVERVLDEPDPASITLSTRQAYQFLREFRPVLVEQGFAVECPPWWDTPAARLGAKLRLTSDPIDALLAPDGGPGMVPAARLRMGLSSLVTYDWEMAIGGTTLSLQEFEKLAAARSSLLRINGRWVEVRPEDLRAAIRFMQENPGGKMHVGEAIRLAYGAQVREGAVPIVGLETSGWISILLGDQAGTQQLPLLAPPRGFHGTLRPYQLRGLSWMAFLERFGFGCCLADDMGLGKTIQLLALLAHERESADGEPAAEPARPIPPTLLVVPMSVVGNWLHEARRFCPQLRMMLHHGLERKQGDEFVSAAESCDAVITTYALAHRDRDTLARVPWQRVVLDEAQFVKNPATKQSQAVRSLISNTRAALTGTPVENRLSELWSIMEFLNPGYLGSGGNFRKRFAVPIERYRDLARAEQLRALVRPFVLRRLKTEPGVAADLPEKLETREFCHLTSEQAELYEGLVGRMLAEVDRAEGIQRRGLVLSTLIKLKQVCNHPSQLLKDHDAASPHPPSPARSGKCLRLMEMLDELLSAGDQALIFTQFRQMGALLAPMLRHGLDREVLFFHGGTLQSQREALVQKFQRADGSAPILIVSLKAGGVGLNLTAATHVFHFDRWWNPAVEAQATDRAHRIGQHRTVQVHKFVVRGTLEERIDEMLEQKTELAQSIIGSGERWLTELSTLQLREILTLRHDAVGDEE